MAAVTLAIDVSLRPDLWLEMDAQRKKTGGWWKDMRTLRVRLADTVLEHTDFTVIEVSIRTGQVQGIRVLQEGMHSVRLKQGPFLMWSQAEFVKWFSAEDTEAKPALTIEVWAPDHWLGLQQGLFEVLRAFTT